MSKPFRAALHRAGPCRPVTLWPLVLSAALLAHPSAYAIGLHRLRIFAHHAAGAGAPPSRANVQTQNEAAMAEESRDAGLLTDWHLLGRYGHGRPADFTRRFAPERWVKRLPERYLKARRYELVFAQGRFVLPAKLAGRKGVYYAISRTYLASGGEWNLYLESDAQAAVFVDGRRVLTRAANAIGTQRVTIHAEPGYHMVMVKFVAQATPFQVAILPPNSGSRRKNNTPYLQRSSDSEDLMAALLGGAMPTASGQVP